MRGREATEQPLVTHTNYKCIPRFPSRSTRRQSVKVQPKFETNDDCVTSVRQEYTVSGVNTKHSGALRMVQSKLRPGLRKGKILDHVNATEPASNGLPPFVFGHAPRTGTKAHKLHSFHHELWNRDDNFGIAIVDFGAFLDGSDNQAVTNEMLASFKKSASESSTFSITEFHRSGLLGGFPRLIFPRTREGHPACVRLRRNRRTVRASAHVKGASSAGVRVTKPCRKFGSRRLYFQASKKHHQFCYKIELRILRALALGLQLPEECAQPTPYVPTEALETEKIAWIGQHSDFGSITLLFQDDVGGLEVEDPHFGGSFRINLALLRVYHETRDDADIQTPEENEASLPLTENIVAVAVAAATKSAQDAVALQIQQRVEHTASSILPRLHEASRRNSGASRVVLGYAHWVPLNETNTEWMEGTRSASCLALVCLARSRGSDPGIAKGGAVLPKDLMAVSVPKKGSAQTSVPACGTVPQNLADYVREFTVSDPHRHLAGKAATGTIREGSGHFYCAEIPLDILRILAARCPLLGRLNLHFQRQRFLLPSSKDFAEALSPIRHTFATLCIRQPHWDGMPASVSVLGFST
ncbi:hypothetical protein B0H14DRAFT_2560514 [Mycena olivaceomarginata]|nr:hypothetical protein B0H14DRAFT_2560514 [Mycena olivaceomarginata]